MGLLRLFDPQALAPRTPRRDGADVAALRERAALQADRRDCEASIANLAALRRERATLAGALVPLGAAAAPAPRKDDSLPLAA